MLLVFISANLGKILVRNISSFVQIMVCCVMTLSVFILGASISMHATFVKSEVSDLDLAISDAILTRVVSSHGVLRAEVVLAVQNLLSPSLTVRPLIASI